ATDEIFERDVADLRGAAVLRIVPVVAQHEIVACRDRVDAGIVVETFVDKIERDVACAVRQRLAPLSPTRDAPARIGVGEILDPFALDRRAVEIERSLDYLNAIAGQPDHALDVVSRRLARQPEYHDIAVARLRGEDAAGKDRRR